jgi:dolichol-phosphate mannosyltransferase
MVSLPENSPALPREVPAYRVDYEVPKARRYALGILVINEGEKIRKQLRAVQAFTGLVDVIVADGGSTDGSLTPELFRETGATALLVKTGPGKLSAQMRMLFSFCLERGYDGVVCIDGNGKDGLDGIPRMLAALEEGYDHVQGSRFIAGGYHENTPWVRLAGLKLLHAPLISLAAGFRYTDTTNGFRAYSRHLLEDPGVAVFRGCFDRYQLHYHLAIEASRLGFRVTEVPVSRTYPAGGKTPTKIRGFRGPASVLWQLLEVCLGRYRLGAGKEEGLG